MGEKVTAYESPVVSIGNLLLGGRHPVRLQSMTNTDTLDTASSVAQCIRIIEAGGELVRLTAQGTREAENLAIIKKELRKAGFDTPLIADIHFNPAAAETAARLVEKVRINPGNYTDKRASFQAVELTEKEYNAELERIHSRLFPLINICREHGTAIRIGINHGSLSDRIMTRYGNTPKGMVMSALEFIEIFRSENFGNLVLSMKSSDTSIMVESTRMLVESMIRRGMAYPIHLGVTEAGEGEDGRVRSAAGIGALLQEGIGDTIRVSLSEDPEKEIPVAKKIADYFSPERRTGRGNEKTTFKTSPEKPGIFRKVNGPLVVADFRQAGKLTSDDLLKAGFIKENGIMRATDNSADLVLLSNGIDALPGQVKIAVPHAEWMKNKGEHNIFPYFMPGEYTAAAERSGMLNVILADKEHDIPSPYDPSTSVLLFSWNASGERHAASSFILKLQDKKEKCSIVLQPVFNEANTDDLRLKASALLGKYIIDDEAAGISIRNDDPMFLAESVSASFSILQCTGKRITRTVYLSCPTCGRTKFNLQETIRKVKEATGHLKGIKIAVMGCIVNGPGEMAGADYGYVGAGPGKVHIYKGVLPVLKNVPEQDAVSELLKVISEDTQ